MRLVYSFATGQKSRQKSRNSAEKSEVGTRQLTRMSHRIGDSAWQPLIVQDSSVRSENPTEWKSALASEVKAPSVIKCNGGDAEKNLLSNTKRAGNSF